MMLELPTMDSALRLVFMGTPQFAVPSLEGLAASHSIAAVYTQPDRPAGRGRAPEASPVKKAALALGLTVEQPVSLRQAEAVARLAQYRPEVIVVAAYGLILPRAVLEIPLQGCVNVHPSLLPRHRGASPVATAILAGDEVTGVSIMLMDEGMDTGPVLAREKTAIAPDETTGSLTARLALIAARLLEDTLPRWARGEITPEPQNNAEATDCRPFAKAAGQIDWRLPAPEIWRRVRAYNPWPGAYTRWQSRQLKVLEAKPRDLAGEHRPGEVVAIEGQSEAFGVACGQGLLEVTRVQLEGKQAMAASDFLRGQRNFIGAVLPDQGGGRP